MDLSGSITKDPSSLIPSNSKAETRIEPERTYFHFQLIFRTTYNYT